MVSGVLHLDQHITWAVAHYHEAIYWILFVVVFVENGVVFIPFLPGDSLVFVCGSLAATHSLRLDWLTFVFLVSSVLGATFNYWLGVYFKRHLDQGRLRFISRQYIDQTQAYFDKYGALTIGFARFLPIVRTFAPFLAGVARMDFKKFMFFNVLGGVVWSVALLLAGYYFGRIPLVRDNLGEVVLVILVVSLLPVLAKLVWPKSRT